VADVAAVTGVIRRVFARGGCVADVAAVTGVIQRVAEDEVEAGPMSPL
jgi:hypothetical protein